MKDRTLSVSLGFVPFQKGIYKFSFENCEFGQVTKNEFPDKAKFYFNNTSLIHNNMR